MKKLFLISLITLFAAAAFAAQQPAPCSAAFWINGKLGQKGAPELR